MTTAVNGERLPKAVKSRRKGTVVLTDNDPEVARLVGAQLNTAGCLAVLTSDSSEAVAAADDYMTKPFNPQDLTGRIERLVR